MKTLYEVYQKSYLEHNIFPGTPSHLGRAMTVGDGVAVSVLALYLRGANGPLQTRQGLRFWL